LNAEGGHLLKKADGAGHGNVDVGLLQPVAEARIKQLDFSGSRCFHLPLHHKDRMGLQKMFGVWIADFS
jgi:hypothetical protein